MRAELLRVSPRRVLFVILPALLLTEVDALGQAVADGVRPARVLGVLLLTAALLWLAAAYLDARGARRRADETVGAGDRGLAPAPSDGRGFLDRGSRTGAMALAAVALVLWLGMFALYGPFVSMNDTVHIINDPFGVARQHPIMYNLVTAGMMRGLGWLLGWQAAAALTALAQMLLFTAILAWMLLTLDRLGVPRAVRAALAVVLGLFPLTANYSFALVKDAPFAAFVLALAAVLLTVHATRGQALRSRGFAALFVATLVCFAVTRNNALPVVVVVVVAVVLVASCARRRAVLLGIGAMLLALVPQQLVSALAGPQQFVEAVGVPLQMVGSTLVSDPACIPANDAAYFEQVMPAAQWRRTFTPLSVDRVKGSPDFDRDYLQATKQQFLAHVASTFRACPAPMLRGYLVHTQPLWQLDGLAVSVPSQSVFLEPISNYPGNRAALIAELQHRGIRPWHVGPEGLRSGEQWVLAHTPGTGVWVTLALLLAVLFAYARRLEGWAVLLPAILLWGTLMVAAPVGLPFRYVAFLPWVVLVGLALLLSIGSAAPREGSARIRGRHVRKP